MNPLKRSLSLQHLEETQLIIPIKRSPQNRDMDCDPTTPNKPRVITSVIEQLINDEIKKETEDLQRECGKLREENRELKQKLLELENKLKELESKNRAHELWPEKLTELASQFWDGAIMSKGINEPTGFLPDQPAAPYNDTPRSYSPELGCPYTPLNRSPSPSPLSDVSPPDSKLPSVNSQKSRSEYVAETDEIEDSEKNNKHGMNLDRSLERGLPIGVETTERDVRNEDDVLNEIDVDAMEWSESEYEDTTVLIDRFPENMFGFLVDVPISMLEVSTLSGHKYLDGQIIDLMTIHYGKEFGEKSISKKVKFANKELFQSWTYIKQITKKSGRELDFTKLIENNGRNEELRILKNHLDNSELDFDVFEKDAISIPIHHQQHWTYAFILNPKGALINTKKRNDSKPRCRILFFDSNAPSASSKSRCPSKLLQAVRLVVSCLMEARFKKYRIRDHEFTRDRVEAVQVANVPQQTYSDCGLFVILFIRGVLSNISEWLKPEKDEKYFDWQKLVHPELRSYPPYYRLAVLNRIMQDASPEVRDYVAMRFFPPPDAKEIDVQSSTTIPSIWFNEKTDFFDKQVASRTRSSCAWKTFSSKNHSLHRGVMKNMEKCFEKLKGFDLHYGGNLESKRIEIVEAKAIRQGTHQDFGIVKSNALMMKVAETKIKVDFRYIWCDICNKHFIEGCFLHPMVRIKDIVPAKMNSPTHASETCPLDWVRIAKSDLHGYGVFANADLFIGMVFGPFQGNRLSRGANPSYSWTVWLLNGGKVEIDSTDQSTSNWMRFVNAPNGKEGNVEGVQYENDIYYRVIKYIAKDEELSVYCGDEYAEDLEKEKLENTRKPESESDLI